MNVKTWRWVADRTVSRRLDEICGRFDRRALEALALALAMFLLPTFANAATADEQPLATNVRFEPTRPLTGDKIKMYLTLKNAVRAELKWTVNDDDEQLMDYDGISGYVEFDKTLKAGDTLKVAITPFSGMSEPGKTVIKSVKVLNGPPTLKLASQELRDHTYVAKIDANDPEKGKMELKVQGPEGMRIDEEGNITWPIKKGVEGNFTVKVTAKDDQGAEASLTYAIRIRQPGRR